MNTLLMGSCLSLFLLGTVLSRAEEARSDAGIKNVVHEFAEGWNMHNPSAMADAWVTDGDVIIPVGRVAKGHAEIVELFTDEQTGPFKHSTIRLDVSGIRWIGAHHAFVDVSGHVTGVEFGPNQPKEFDNHLVLLMAEHENKWKIIAARPYSFIQPPPMAK
ncbi:MAG: SgcJ/EcaC family oxidoreductase [Kiritimatiellae bacterium]|nr:SgcJ/EcaC family oxidoreductase [Kiritimatiellia bacterium]MCO5062262.1 SgcJ/EcaC family oxidoreductase [Kiritimatiellia bacterium]MCO6401591.1 SgcJ/EcaC family oxidoreductase [Verrucomicrobiota bacterium]